MIVAGIGCRRGCSTEAILDVVAEALRRAALEGDMLGGLAAPAFKRDEPGLPAAALALGLPLRWIAADALARMQPRCVTRSAAAAAAHGVASVAEASALAGAGTGARLTLPRVASRIATCALAEGEGP